MPDSDFHHLARTLESMLALMRAGDGDSAIAIWQGLDALDQQKVFYALASMVNAMRADRGDPPDATYGPPELKGL